MMAKRQDAKWIFPFDFSPLQGEIERGGLKIHLQIPLHNGPLRAFEGGDGRRGVGLFAGEEFFYGAVRKN